MPLNKSKSEGAFRSNVKAEINAGKPQNQALAIAYRIKRGYDDGGTVDPVVLPQDPNPLADNPFSHYVAQKLYGLGQGVVDAATLPGDVYAGRTDPTSDEGEERTFNLAQMMTGTPRGGSLGSGIILPKGIRAYHGSPYDFDRFDMSKIGTGEGAQAYGHGLYFAGNEDVARIYRDNLARPNFSETKSGVPISSDLSRILEDAYNDAMNIHGVKAPSGNDAIHLAQQNIDKQRAIALKSGDFEWFSKLADQQAELSRMGKDAPKYGGRMYEVNINAHPDQFLDYDNPLSEQSSHVKSTLSGLGIEDTGGQSLINYLAEKFGDSSRASKSLRDAGIPGIKYLDQGSRGSGTGTSNYVVFNDGLIHILRKYRLGGNVGATAVAGQNDMKYASGGNVLPFYARSEARNLEHSGFIHSPVPGRTDRLPMGVKGGSYVLPADTVSAVGQGNSLAGAHALTKLFGMGPYGSSMPHISGGRPSIPKLPSVKPPKFARGGPVDIVAAGGEMVIPPHVVAQIGKGDMKLGHDILDAFVKHTRAKTVKKLKSLPDPKKK